MLKCQCPLYYVGQTTHSLRTRLLEHQSRIRLKTPEAPLVEHFLTKGHREDAFKCTVLHVGKSSSDHIHTELLRSDAYWAKRLDTLVPVGLNNNIDLSCFL